MERKPSLSEIIPLALPKGKEKNCELCQRRAHLQCDRCKVTFYCNSEHQRYDWAGIHHRICQLLIPIRNPFLPGLETISQAEMQQKKADLIDICRLEAQKRLCERRHQEALPAAQSCMRCSTDVHGANTVHLVPAYLLLAEANMGLGNLPMVMELLSQAEWLVLRNPGCGHSIQQRLHRSLGHVYTATGDQDTALFHYANDVYYASMEYGLDSTVTSDSFFLMAGVFAKQGKLDITRSIYTAAAQTWHQHLSELFNIHMENIQNPSATSEPSYDKSRMTAVDEMLRSMLAFQQDASGEDAPREDPAQVALLGHCLAMLWFLEGDKSKALGFGSTALQASQLIPDHELRADVEGLLQLLHSSYTEPRPGPAESPAPGT